MSAHPPSPPLQNPVQTLDTSPQTLGLTRGEDASPASAQSASLPSRRSSASKNVLKRTVENTAAKLGGSAFLGSSSGRRESSGTPVTNRLSASLSSTPRRFLSLSRKGKGKDQGGGSSTEIAGVIGECLLYRYFASFVGDGNARCDPRKANYRYLRLCEQL